ncbi:unnamed protein product [Trichobilharzia regenti]|nr:unnamed protein product [Trichobilharzia regenti]
MYVTGESYGGVYVPTLALLLKDSPRFKLMTYLSRDICSIGLLPWLLDSESSGSNLTTPTSVLEGIAVGNGLTSHKLNDNSLLYFIRYHGLVDESSWNDLVAKCCADPCSTWCAFTDNKTGECQRILNNHDSNESADD